jgi:hypothetical protein
LGALLAVLGLVVGVVCLGIPPARRAFAETQARVADPKTGAVAGTDAGMDAVPELPASLRGAAVWLRVGGGFGAAGSVGVAVLSVAAGDTVGAAIAVFAAVGVLACAAGAGAAAATARQRRRGAAQLARAAAAAVLVLLLIALQLGTIYVVGWVVWAETTGPTGFDPVVVPMIVAVVIGIVATLAGIAVSPIRAASASWCSRNGRSTSRGGRGRRPLSARPRRPHSGRLHGALTQRQWTGAAGAHSWPMGGRWTPTDARVPG